MKIQGQAHVTPNISLFQCHICIIKLMSGYNTLFSCETVNLCDTQQEAPNKSLFTYHKMRRAERCGAKSLNTTILFHGGDCPLPSLCACEVSLKSWLVLLIWGWVRPICHLVRRGRKGGTFFNCQVTWCRDRRSFGHIVCLCVKDQPSEIPDLIMREGRLIDQFTNWQPQD